ncbi:MAG: hypothetical protein RIS47_1627 [Bacteroidota bacterium]|jgi:hypothetical protein
MAQKSWTNLAHFRRAKRKASPRKNGNLPLATTPRRKNRIQLLEIHLQPEHWSETDVNKVEQ